MGGWWLGRHAARGGLNKEGRFAEKRKKALDAGGKVEATWGRLIVFFVPSWVSGALGMPARQFAFWNFFAAALWNVGAALASYGAASAATGKAAVHVIAPIAIAAVAAGAMVWIFRSVRRRHRRRTEQLPLVPDA
jgi:membrane protein DedA with SNARE-associated domain